MANEELHQRGYLAGGKLQGTKFGDFEKLDIGSTSVAELKAVGVDVIVPALVEFPFTVHKPVKTPPSVKPDVVFLRRQNGKLAAVAVAEHKAPKKFRTNAQLTKAAEQGLYGAVALGATVVVTSDGLQFKYVDVVETLKCKKLVYFSESRDFGPGVLANLLAGDAGQTKDPAPLAETVWQTIWHATKEEPKQCLLTFVEIFVLKFLSDNLPVKVLPEDYRFYGLLSDPKKFHDSHGITALEYYATKIRPFIKTLFPDNIVAVDPQVATTFGLDKITSKTSVINGFAFWRSSDTLPAFNRTFLDILDDFQKFGPLTTIDPEFKLRLYETFLKRSARQQKLGQFFTPRNVVRAMIRMARLDKLQDGAVVLDPAAGVGGFILEPPLIVPALANNVTFAKGQVHRRIKFIGVDVDANTHILAKANTLIHFAEAVRDPSITMGALNRLMAETFILMNKNETLGSLVNPPKEVVDVILTNPPYVTKGSGVYNDEIKEVGVGENGIDLRDYYDGSGLGVEARFIRYICGALRHGGRAFVIVPLGFLNRTDPGPKRRILEECNLLASISLPRNTFFNTAQLTSILVLEKRHTVSDARPDVLCALPRTIGETLNWERVPAPDQNDLAEVAETFIKHTESSSFDSRPFVRIVKPDQFSENDRWDVVRFWTDNELVALGHKETAVTRADFIDETQAEIQEIGADLGAAKGELILLTSGPMKSIKLGDPIYFNVRSGTRVRGRDIRENPGDLPIYSCFRTEGEIKGFVDEEFFSKLGGAIEEKPIVTVNANGASVGHVYTRRERCGMTDDVVVIELNDQNIDLDYLAVALQAAVDKGGFIYEAKLFTSRVRELVVDIPSTAAGSFDVSQQQAIASAVRRFNALRGRLHDLGVRSATARAV